LAVFSKKRVHIFKPASTSSGCCPGNANGVSQQRLFLWNQQSVSRIFVDNRLPPTKNLGSNGIVNFERVFAAVEPVEPGVVAVADLLNSTEELMD
jgi:hypothetical protein